LVKNGGVGHFFGRDPAVTVTLDMNRANQIKLVQKTNLDVVAIRMFEINYYVTLYQTFGTQAALIVGD